MPTAYRTSETFTPDNLIGGGYPLHTTGVTIASGQGALSRGAVLGKVTATGKHVLSLAAANDGSQVPDCILVEAVNAASADVAVLAYDGGEFVESALTLGAGHTVASIRDGLRERNIYFVKSK